MSAAIRGPNSFDLISVRQSTIDRLRDLKASIGAENYDEVLLRLLSGASRGASPSPIPRQTCGATHRWHGRTITCRLRDLAHIRSPVPGRRRHVWWTYGGEKVEWDP